MRMTTESFPAWHEFQISRRHKDLDNPDNAPYLYADPYTGERFIDWANPGARLEKWANSISCIAQGAPEEVDQKSRDAYYSKFCAQNGLFPDEKLSMEAGLPKDAPIKKERLCVYNYEPEQIKKFRKMMTTYTAVTLIGSAIITSFHERNPFAPMSYDAILREMLSGIKCDLDSTTESFIGRLDKLAASSGSPRVNPMGVIGRAFLQAAKGILSDTPHADLLRKIIGETGQSRYADLNMLLKTFDTVHQYDLDMKIEPSSITNYREMLESPDTCKKLGKLVASGMREDYGESLTFVEMLAKMADARGESKDNILNLLLFNFDLMLKDDTNDPYFVLGDAFLALAGSMPDSGERPHMMLLAKVLPNAGSSPEMRRVLDLMLEFDLVRRYSLDRRSKWLELLDKIYPEAKSATGTML